MTPKPVIVLVPGAFHSPASYTKIIDPLRDQGYDVLPIQLVVTGDDPSPESTHLDDAAEIHRLLLPILDDGREAVIVSHSYGSLPATASVQGQTVSERAGRGLKGGIVGVVSIAGFAFPARGRNVLGGDAVFPPQEYHVVENGITHLQPPAKPIFFSDLSPPEADNAWATLYKKQSRKSFEAFPQYTEAEIQCPKTYILCENDVAVHPEFQEQMATLGGFEIVRVQSGHSPFLKVPDQVVGVIGDFVSKVRSV